MTAKPSSEPLALDGKILMTENHNKPGRKPRPIHMSALQIPMTYEAVLDIVPGLHGRPPRLPETEDQFFPPPPEMGYDFVFHVGAAGRGALRMERVGHKLGYHMKDLSGKLASLVRALPKDFSRVEAENTERERVGVDAVSDGVNGIDHLTHTTRGFGGPAYENFPDEIMTDIDVLRLIGDLKRSGIEVYKISCYAWIIPSFSSKSIAGHIHIHGRRTLSFGFCLLLLSGRGQTERQTLRKTP